MVNNDTKKFEQLLIIGALCHVIFITNGELEDGGSYGGYSTRRLGACISRYVAIEKSNRCMISSCRFPETPLCLFSRFASQ